ncbi:hypothetical protein [Blastococcus sp. CCUG 61487]|uniref:hypothetical protein n=1 Tax=Blastococcus sp. CCUG 61487 TaxID=1840703 RepID=UPI0014858C55|nr:hypothetical protein [Blastococcus sp. CCUG 61487]
MLPALYLLAGLAAVVAGVTGLLSVWAGLIVLGTGLITLGVLEARGTGAVTVEDGEAR